MYTIKMIHTQAQGRRCFGGGRGEISYLFDKMKFGVHRKARKFEETNQYKNNDIK